MPQMRIWEALHALATRIGTNPLTGQTAVIVGASSGLGFVIARELAHAGCKLAICARDASELERTRRELVSAGAAVFARPLDATRPDQVEDFVHATVRRFGSLDMLITCAVTPEVGPLETTTSHDVQEAFEQIFWAAYYPTMAVLPHMRERRHGRVVHVGCAEGRVAMPAWTGRSALSGFSSSLRAEVAKDGVSVTTVAPGFSLPATELSARRILRAAALRKAESTLTLGTRLLVIANAVAPNLIARLLPVRAMGARGQSRAREEIEVLFDELRVHTGSPPSLLRAGPSSAN